MSSGIPPSEHHQLVVTCNKGRSSKITGAADESFPPLSGLDQNQNQTTTSTAFKRVAVAGVGSSDSLEDKDVAVGPGPTTSTSVVAEDVVKTDSNLSMSKSAKKRSKRRAAKKEVVMSMMEFSNGLPKNVGAGDANSPPLPQSTDSTHSSVGVNALVTQNSQQQSQQIGLPNTWAWIVSGRNSQEAFFGDEGYSEQDCEAIKALLALKGNTTMALQIGKDFAEIQSGEQKTMAFDAEDEKKNVGSQTDNMKGKGKKGGHRSMGTTTKGLAQEQPPGSNSWAAIVSGKDNQDGFATESGSFERETEVNGTLNKSTMARMGIMGTEQETQAGETARAKKDVAIQAAAGIENSKTLAKNGGRRSTGTMTMSIPKVVTQEQGVTVKMCDCGEADKSLPVEFYGNQFKFEAALALAVSNLGITFLDCNDNVDLNDELVGEQNNEFPEFVPPAQF